jgi:O-acetyl-ADP-ribose deacetylase (regulator of RNase III)
MAVQTKIQHRRDTAANWTSTNPTLASGEIGFETDTLKFKIGDGSTAWISLVYQGGSGGGSGTVTSITASSPLTGGTITTSGSIGIDASSTSTANYVVQRDANGSFLANVVTANIVGKVTVDSAGTSPVGEIFVTQPVVMGTSATGTISASTLANGIYTATVTAVSGSLTNVTANMIATATAGTGNFGVNPAKVTSIINTTAYTISSATVVTNGSITAVNFFSVPSATPVTGDLWFW